VSYFAGGPQIVSIEPNVALHIALQHDAAIFREQLDLHVQFGRSGYRGHCAPRFTAGTIFCYKRLQDKDRRTSRGVSVTAAEYVFELF